MMNELTPEEKRKIYLEEKTRLEAKEQLAKEKQQQQTQGCLKGCLVTILIFVGLILIIGVVGTCENKQGTKYYGNSNERLLAEHHSRGEFLGYEKGEGDKWARDIAVMHEATEKIRRGEY
jgi:hypothetical protein